MPQPGEGQSGSTGVAPAPDIRHLTGDGLKQGWDMDLRGGPRLVGSMSGQGRAGPYKAEDWPCCGVAGTTADCPGELTWAPRPWAGWREPQGG